MDTLSPQQRHVNMAAIHGKDTKPELIVRRYLWAHGFRYRLNHPRLPGKPDIVMRKYRTCVFVNGCFWHGHRLREAQSEKTKVKSEKLTFDFESSDCCRIPKTNRDFWVNKIKRNKERDTRVQHELSALGWHSITIWECELRPKVREKTLTSLEYTLNKIFLQDHSVKRYDMPEEEIRIAAEDTEQIYK